MIKNKTSYAVSFQVVIYRNQALQEIKQEFTIITGEPNRNTIANQASNLIRAGKQEIYEPACGSVFGGEYVTIERKLGNILNITELPPPDGTEGINYAHAYAEDSRYNYNG